MAFKDKLKKLAHFTAVISSAASLHAAPSQPEPDNIQQNTPPSSVTRPTTEYLDYRVRRGPLINGETQSERSARWAAFKKEHGAEATFHAIRKETIGRLEIPQKDEKGYLFETYEPGKKHSFESYYPHGVLQARTTGHGEAAQGFYPDGSKKFDRTADGIETHYYPGGPKGQEKIKETPHGLLDAYDVLDEQGHRTEHHYAITESPARKTEDGTITSRDVKKVDLYDPQSQDIIATYTLDHWGVSEGRLAQIGFIDESGALKTMDFPAARKIGDSNYYAKSLSLDQIKEIYREELQERTNQGALQQAFTNRVSQK